MSRIESMSRIEAMSCNEADPAARVSAPPVAAPRRAPRALPPRCAWCPDLIGCRVPASERFAIPARTAGCDARAGRRIVAI